MQPMTFASFPAIPGKTAEGFYPVDERIPETLGHDPFLPEQQA